MSTKIIIIEKTVVDQVMDLRAELIILCEQVCEEDGKYTFAPLPTQEELFTQLLDKNQIPFLVLSPSTFPDSGIPAIHKE
jgi:hypothetical protein